MNKPFQVIVCDMPWSFGDKLRHSAVKRGAESNYQTMSISEIKQLPINAIADPEGAVLCLWVPSSLIKEGVEIVENYGFTVKQTYVWVKVKKEPLGVFRKSYSKIMENLWKKGAIHHFSVIKELLVKSLSDFSLTEMLGFNMGRLFRQTHEICLIATNNNKIYQQLQNKSQRSVCLAPNLKHSAKPEDLQNALDLQFPAAKKIELFARRTRKGWTTIGNQNPTSFGEDIRVSLAKLL